MYCTNYYDSTFLFFKQNVPANAVFITSDEAYFHLSDFANKKIFNPSQKATVESYMKSFSTVSQ